MIRKQWFISRKCCENGESLQILEPSCVRRKSITAHKKQSLELAASLGAACQWRHAQMSLLGSGLSSFPGGDPGG